MAETLSVDVKTSLEWLFQDVDALTTISDTSKLTFKHSFADGTAADQADLLWYDERTVATAATDDLDLSALTRSVFGSVLTVAFAKVKSLLIVNTASTAGEDLTIGAATSNAWTSPFGAGTHTLEVPADSPLLMVNRKTGWSVIDSSSDVLRIANSGTADITYRIAIVGTSI